MTPGGHEDDGAMARALAAGLPAEDLAVLMAARRQWWARNEGLPTPADHADVATVLWSQSLAAALAHPAADAFDEVFVAAARRHYPEDHPVR